MTFGPESRIYFHHVPKTAGTTVTSYLKDHFHSREFCPEQRDADALLQMPREVLLSYRLFCGHLGNYLFDLLPQRPLTVIWLRDPVQLIYSFYRFARAKSQKLQDMAADPVWKEVFRLAPQMTFDEYVETDEAHAVLHNMHERMLGHGRITVPEQTQLAARLLDESFHIGLVDRMPESIASLSVAMDRFPMDASREINVTTEVPTPLSDEVRARVMELNARDAALYRRGREIFQRRLDAMIARIRAEGYLDDSPVDARSLHAAARLRFLQKQKVAGLPADERFDFTMPSSIENWRPAAGLKRRTRWSGPGTESSIYLRFDETRNAIVRVMLGRVKDRAIVDGLTFRVNGVDVAGTRGREFFADYDRKVDVFRLRVDASVIRLADGGLSELQIIVPFTVINDDLAGLNPRVGVEVGEVSITPLDEAAMEVTAPAS